MPEILFFFQGFEDMWQWTTTGFVTGINKKRKRLLENESNILSDKGRQLETKLIDINNFNKELTAKKKSMRSSSDFIEKKNCPFYKAHGNKMQNSVLWHLFEHMMEVVKGNSGTKLGRKVIIF